MDWDGAHLALEGGQAYDAVGGGGGAMQTAPGGGGAMPNPLDGGGGGAMQNATEAMPNPPGGGGAMQNPLSGGGGGHDVARVLAVMSHVFMAPFTGWLLSSIATNAV